VNHLKKLQSINDDLQKQVNLLAYKNLGKSDSRSIRKSTRKSTQPNTPSKTPTLKKYYIQVGTGSRCKRSRKRSRKRKRKGGLSFWGSTTNIKPCESDCKSECPYECKTICDRAIKYTASSEDRAKINSLLAQNENLRNLILVYS
jgi:hypothetical protein